MKSKTELIEDSREITAIKDAHYYLTESHGFEPEEIDYLLLFENPLQVVADKWRERTEDLSDFSFALDEVFDKQDALRDYELKENLPCWSGFGTRPVLRPRPKNRLRQKNRRHVRWPMFKYPKT
jgi:hypothetical protein